jgi:hypothetical protein
VDIGIGVAGARARGEDAAEHTIRAPAAKLDRMADRIVFVQPVDGQAWPATSGTHLAQDRGMSTPRTAPPLLAEPPGIDGASAPMGDIGQTTGPGAPSISHAWDDQEIDVAGTEADPGFPRSDRGA